jgi:hypothetical protein
MKENTKHVLTWLLIGVGIFVAIFSASVLIVYLIHVPPLVESTLIPL